MARIGKADAERWTEIEITMHVIVFSAIFTGGGPESSNSVHFMVTNSVTLHLDPRNKAGSPVIWRAQQLKDFGSYPRS